VFLSTISHLGVSCHVSVTHAWRLRGETRQTPSGVPLDPRLLEALRKLDRDDASYAELCRAIAPAAARLGLRRPSYMAVRKAVIAFRPIERLRKAEREQLVVDLINLRTRRIVERNTN
jgi:hypothetical protein